MSTPASKRRRLDSNTSSALHKPFRTPLKKPATAAPINGTHERSDNPASITNSNTGNETKTENANLLERSTRGCVKHNGCTAAATRTNALLSFVDKFSPDEPVSTGETNRNTPEACAPGTPATVVTSSAHGQSTPITSHDQGRHRRLQHGTLTPSYSDTRKLGLGHVSDPDIAAAQKEQRALEQRQRGVRADIDVLEQALRVTRRRQGQHHHQDDVKTKKKEKSQQQCNESIKRTEDPKHKREINGDVRLENLIVKWRNASQQAVEEIFAGARDRVNRMGGVAAWKEQEREKLAERQQGNNSGSNGSSWGWDVAGAAKYSDGGDDDYDGRGQDEDEQGEEESRYDKMIKEEEEEERVLQEAASGFDGNVSERITVHCWNES